MADEKTRIFLPIFLIPFNCDQCEGPDEQPVAQPQCNRTKLLDLLETFVTTRVSQVMWKFIYQLNLDNFLYILFL